MVGQHGAIFLWPAYTYKDLLGERIWGRGSSDDKSGVIGIMTAVEVLISAGFKPTRSVVLAFGFDEECGGSFVRIPCILSSGHAYKIACVL